MVENILEDVVELENVERQTENEVEYEVED